jgi:hypothetical protein
MSGSVRMAWHDRCTEEHKQQIENFKVLELIRLNKKENFKYLKTVKMII